MSLTNRVLRYPVANHGGFGDPDLTPKPLQISKRKQTGPSNTGNIKSSPSIRKSQTHCDLQILASSKRSSTRVNSMQLDLSRQDLTVPTSEWARRNAFLHVHKQRRSEPIKTSTAATTGLTATIEEPISLSPSIPPARSRDSCPTMSQFGSSSDASQAITVARPPSTRAFTTGTYRKFNPLSPVHEVSSSTSASSALRQGQRRAVSNAEAFYNDLDALKSLAHRGLRKQRSFKNSFMSRMMTGLTNRTHVGHAVPWEAHQGTRTLDSLPSTPSRARNVTYPLRQSNSSEMHPLRQSNSSGRSPLRPSISRDSSHGTRTLESPPPTPSWAHKGTPPLKQSNSSDRYPLRQTDSGTRTQTYCENDLHRAQAAFPTPPASNPTSPTTGSFTSQSRPERFRDLCTPANAVLMGAELKLTPEYDQLSSGHGRGMLVSLDIRGITNSTSSVQDVWSEHTGLDVVVVIDNSLHTSPAALMASCETARFLASILNRITDRFAILCTSTTGISPTDSTIAMELSHINLHSIKIALDAITSSAERPKPNAWVDTIHCAEELLLRSAVPDPDEEPIQDTFGHIFLFTPNPDGLPLQSLVHEKLTFHLISPAGAPRSDQSIQCNDYKICSWSENEVQAASKKMDLDPMIVSSIHCNGWKLRSLSENDTQVVSKKKDLDPMSVSNRLRVLISQARNGKVLGSLTDLVLEVSAGPDCAIEGFLGKVKFTKLHPGEVFTALFKLRVRATTADGYSLSCPATPPSEALLDTKDIMNHLDKMLGTIDAKILTARLTYRHSLLPAGTTCSITSVCHMKRVRPDPDQKLSPSKRVSQVRDCTILVEKRLAYYQATHGSPRSALKVLHQEYGDRFHNSVCPDYINLLAKELRYQARIVERLEIDVSPRKSSAVRPADSPSEKRSQSCFDDENYTPGHRTTGDIPTEELFIAKPALAVLSLKKSREQLRTDEARKIWGDMRKMKRPPDQTMIGRSLSSQVEEARKESIRELAVKNKRSVGSETLRSIFSAGESMGKGLGAPWM